MTEADHVKTVHVFADGNPLPGIASFRFTPACGKAAASTRMRLAQSQNIVAIAEMADGSRQVTVFRGANDYLTVDDLNRRAEALRTAAGI